MPRLANRRTLALYAILGVVVIGVALKVWLPTHRRLSQMRAELEQKRQYLAASQGLQKAVEAEYAELDRIKAYLRSWSKAVETNADLSKFFGRAHALARETGVTATGFSPESPVVYERVRHTPVQLGCTGTFDQIAAFVYSLERDAGLIWIDRLQIEQSGESGKTLLCQIKLAIFAVHSDETDEVKPPDAATDPGPCELGTEVLVACWAFPGRAVQLPMRMTGEPARPRLRHVAKSAVHAYLLNP